MSNLKYYNDSTGQWEYLVIGKQGPTGATGATGATGNDGALSPNYIINGAFDIWQRGDGPFDGNEYSADRWETNNFTGGTATLTKQEFTEGDLEVVGFGDAKYFSRLDVTTAFNFLGIRTRIEDVRTLSGQTATLSFYAKGTNPGAATSLRILVGQDFGNGGSSSNQFYFPDFTVTSSWQRFTFTFDVPSVFGTTIGTNSNLNVSIQQNGGDAPDAWTLDIWGVQLEAGSVATPFKRHAPSLQGELAACQRYYTKIGGPGNANRAIASGFCSSTTASLAIGALPTTMRTSPSVSIVNATDFRIRTGAGAFICTSVNVFTSDSTPNTYFIGGVVNTAGLTLGQGCLIYLGPTGEIELGAEL